MSDGRRRRARRADAAAGAHPERPRPDRAACAKQPAAELVGGDDAGVRLGARARRGAAGPAQRDRRRRGRWRVGADADVRGPHRRRHRGRAAGPSTRSAARSCDGRLWGRGSADMKGGVAAMMFATDALARRGPFPGRIVIAALVDEEGMMARRQALRRHAAARTASTARSAASPRAARSATSPRERCGCASTSPARWPTARCRSRAATRTAPSAPSIGALADLEAAVQARTAEHPYLGKVWITPTVLRRRRAGADERDAGERGGVGRRAHDPGGRPRRR